MFTNDVLTIVYSYVSIEEIDKKFSVLISQTSRHSAVRLEVTLTLRFLDAIRKILPDTEVS